jgi:transposase InsO family protein
MCSWVSRFGVPATITSDRGAQFTSALWLGLCSLLNIQLSPTTAYHPQSNGFHRWLKGALRSRAAAADWHDHLPWVMLGIRAPFREDSKFSPAEASSSTQLSSRRRLSSMTYKPSWPAARCRIRSCCWPASFWSAGTARSRCCPQPTTDLTKCWNGQHISLS